MDRFLTKKVMTFLAKTTAVRIGDAKTMAGRFLLLALMALLVPLVEGRQRGDRPGELRLSALSSYGRNGPEHITDPEYWATRTKKHKGEIPEKREGDIIFVRPGSREALQMHETDRRVTKGIKMRAQSRSLSARARSSSAMSRGRSASRTGSGMRDGSVRSGSAIVEATKDKLAAFFADEKTTTQQMLRVLRMYGHTAKEAAPAGFWTSKSRPASIVAKIYMTEDEKSAHSKKKLKMLKAKLKVNWKLKNAGVSKDADLKSGKAEVGKKNKGAKKQKPKKN